MKFNIDLQQLVKDHFGFDVKTSSFDPPNTIIPFGNVKVLEGRDKMVNGHSITKHSALGTPVFDYIKILPSSYYDGAGVLRDVDEYQLPFECVVEVSQPTIVEETQLKGRRSGTVKEIIGLDDYYITARGFLINYKDRNYPTDEFVKLVKALSHPAELQIESPYLSFFGINEIVIMDRNYPQVEGALHYQPFEFISKSNIPYTVDI